jgi:hypothetical protein
MEPDEDEGWYTDPYGSHDARWMSAGRPTKLVRDGDVESYEDPPETEPTQVPERIEAPPGTLTPVDTLRADAAEEVSPSIGVLDEEESDVPVFRPS